MGLRKNHHRLFTDLHYFQFCVPTALAYAESKVYICAKNLVVWIYEQEVRDMGATDKAIEDKWNKISMLGNNIMRYKDGLLQKLSGTPHAGWYAVHVWGDMNETSWWPKQRQRLSGLGPALQQSPSVGVLWSQLWAPAFLLLLFPHQGQYIIMSSSYHPWSVSNGFLLASVSLNDTQWLKQHWYFEDNKFVEL